MLSLIRTIIINTTIFYIALSSENLKEQKVQKSSKLAKN